LTYSRGRLVLNQRYSVANFMCALLLA